MWSLAVSPERPVQPLADDQVLRQRLRGAARLGDHVDQRLPRVESVERAEHGVRVDVVEHRERRPAVSTIRPPLIPGGGLQRTQHRLGAERRAADAEDQQVSVATTPLGRPPLDGRRHVRLPPEPHEAVFAGGAPLAHLGLYRRESRGKRRSQGGIEAVHTVEGVAEHQ
ncbi:MAG: hypothetical protein IPJ11_13225 [Gemmatimonadetes bacterium]|nr:hypothetical protein [Gemmatimonadota bacterium]